MQIGELVRLNTWYAQYEGLGIGKVVDLRDWDESEGPCGCDVIVLWADGSTQVFDESELVHAVDDHESW